MSNDTVDISILLSQLILYLLLPVFILTSTPIGKLIDVSLFIVFEIILSMFWFSNISFNFKEKYLI